MKKYSEDDVNYSKTCKFETASRQSGKLCNDIDFGSTEGKQLDLCKGNIIFYYTSSKYFMYSTMEFGGK